MSSEQQVDSPTPGNMPFSGSEVRQKMVVITSGVPQSVGQPRHLPKFPPVVDGPSQRCDFESQPISSQRNATERAAKDLPEQVSLLRKLTSMPDGRFPPRDYLKVVASLLGRRCCRGCDPVQCTVEGIAGRGLPDGARRRPREVVPCVALRQTEFLSIGEPVGVALCDLDGSTACITQTRPVQAAKRAGIEPKFAAADLRSLRFSLS